MAAGIQRAGAAALLLSFLGAGCLSEETIRRIEGTPGQEGTGITLSRVPEVIRILAVHDATPEQRRAARDTAVRSGASGPEGRSARYLAVQTTDTEASQGAVSVMVWDTESAEIVGNNVYDLAIRPRPGNVAMIDDRPAQFVAAN